MSICPKQVWATGKEFVSFELPIFIGNDLNPPMGTLKQPEKQS